MSFGEIVNYILYAISGFCFGIFASRYCLISASGLISRCQQNGLGGLIASLHYILFILAAFFIFPVWFIAKTQIGGFVYCAVLVFFFSRGYRLYIKKR